MTEASEEASFPHERVEGIILKHTENTIETTPYSEALVPQWISTITEKVMEDLIGLNKPFKYVVSVVIMEQTGGGINVANSAYWDSVRDGSFLFSSCRFRRFAGCYLRVLQAAR